MTHSWKTFALATFCALLSLAPIQSADLTAKGLAADLSEGIEDGNSSARLRMVTGDTTFQIRLKARRTAAKSEIVYQVLYPKERKGECFLLRRERGKSPEGNVFVPPKTMTALDQAGLKSPALGSALDFQDIIENFFRWESQTLVGKEKIDRADCVILESKPGSGDSSPYGSVKSWIDPDKLVPMRVEKYDASGKLAVRIDTTDVAKNDVGRNTPSKLVIRRTGGRTTEIDGSNISHDISFTDRDFSVPTFTDLRIPR
jgi:hypothetical protein